MVKEMSNVGDVSLEAMIKALHSESDSKEKVEKFGSKRRVIALRLAIDFIDTRHTWSTLLDNLNNDETKDDAREKIAVMFGADQYDGADRTNHMTRAINSMAFGVDMVHLNYADNITFNEKGAATIKGNSKLASDLWTYNKWADKKNWNDLTPANELRIVARNSDRNVGAVSWSMLEDFSRAKAGRKQNTNRAIGKPMQTMLTKAFKEEPAKAMALLTSVTKDASPATTKDGRIATIQAAEDILALAIDGDTFGPINKKFSKLFDELYEQLGVNRADATKKIDAFVQRQLQPVTKAA